MQVGKCCSSLRFTTRLFQGVDLPALKICLNMNNLIFKKFRNVLWFSSSMILIQNYPLHYVKQLCCLAEALRIRK